ncbi:MAG: outer membrane lipoprotein chaperone LolA, partial [Gammaproteobacteria bacterium]
MRLIIFSLLAAVLVGSAGHGQEPEAHPADANLDRFLTETTTLQANFEQELRSSDGEIVEVAAGTLSLRRPNQFFWEYSEPLEQVILADGENLWIYDVDLSQATVTPLDDLADATPAMLLSGDLGIRDSFETIEYFSEEGTDWVQLAPTASGADFRSILVGFRSGELA